MSYKIELTQSGVEGARPTMFRCGIKFEVNEPQTFDLTEQELEIFKNDWRFTVSDSTDSSSTITETKIAIGENIPHAVDIAGEEKPQAQIEAIEDSLVAQEEVVDSKVEELPFVEVLLRDFSREELNKQAKKLGIKKPESFENKTEVAQAIVDAQ